MSSPNSAMLSPGRSKDAERPSKNYQDNLQELRDRIEKLESEKRNQNIRRNNNSGRCYICNSTDPMTSTASNIV
jgi:hypothetical protein